MTSPVERPLWLQVAPAAVVAWDRLPNEVKHRIEDSFRHGLNANAVLHGEDDVWIYRLNPYRVFFKVDGGSARVLAVLTSREAHSLNPKRTWGLDG